MTTVLTHLDSGAALDIVRPRRRWSAAHDVAPDPTTLVWIDAREATIVRVHGDRFPVEHITSDVPPQHRSTGHIRHDPAIRHGGGGADQHAGDPRHAEHLGRFLGQVARRVHGERDLVIVGPGEVRQHLARLIRDSGGSMTEDVVVHTEPAARMTDRQLVALLRDLSGHAPRRGRRTGHEPPASWEPERMRPHPRRPSDRRRDRIADALAAAIDT